MSLPYFEILLLLKFMDISKCIGGDLTFKVFVVDRYKRKAKESGKPE
jgi:hypothetical protein